MVSGRAVLICQIMDDSFKQLTLVLYENNLLHQSWLTKLGADRGTEIYRLIEKKTANWVGWDHVWYSNLHVNTTLVFWIYMHRCIHVYVSYNSDSLSCLHLLDARNNP
jgi:hypothetical protein